MPTLFLTFVAVLLAAIFGLIDFLITESA